MENVHKMTRPAWTVNFGKNWFTSGSTIACALVSTSLFTHLFENLLKNDIQPASLKNDSKALAGLVLTFGMSYLVAWLIKLRAPKTDQYPRRFVYCFQKQTNLYAVGTFELRCDTTSGEMQADGYAYDAQVKNAGGVLEKVEIPDGATMRQWTSLHVGASLNRRNTCYIAFKFDPPEHADYLYGLIRFEIGGDNGSINQKTWYLGNINGIAPPPDSSEKMGRLPVFPRVYAELIEGEIKVGERFSRLNEYAPKLKSATEQLP